ncbi:MAG: GMC family oxidoreductase [Burkholderiaceae bacterium]
MFVDSRSLNPGTVLHTDVCIIGGGPAGVAMALEFENAGIPSLILESGAFEADRQSLKLYEGDSVGLPYEFAQGHRSRYLGGNSNCWGGFCRPWDEWAFQKRDWVPNSGWPIDRATLIPYYSRAETLLRTGTSDYDPQSWETKAQRADVKRYRIDASEFTDGVSVLSPPVRFGEEHREHLEASALITVCLWANVTNIQADPLGARIRDVQVQTLSGVKFGVQARVFVLAAGGIENARLLLASRDVHQAGLGNANDLVGRYFADHPRLRWGKVKLPPDQRDNRFYDLTFNFLAGKIDQGSARASGYMALPQPIQRAEGLLDSHVWLRSLFFGEHSTIFNSLARMKQRILAGQRYGFGLGHDALTLMRHPLSTAAFTASYLARLKSLVRETCFEGVVESDPNYNSRVMLSDERDALGMQRTRIDWRLSEQVARTFDVTFNRLADSLEKAGVATIDRGDVSYVRDGWPDSLEGTWHHMGTTRMHASPREGVVDTDSRVHGLANLYVAGSSVFPTYGPNHPTMTLMALALRLADHLVGELRRPTQLDTVPGQPQTASSNA